MKPRLLIDRDRFDEDGVSVYTARFDPFLGKDVYRKLLDCHVDALQHLAPEVWQAVREAYSCSLPLEITWSMALAKETPCSP